MITTAEQYNANLHLIYNDNPPTYATLPHANNIYNIDINTREIDAPRFLAVEKDNISETIYFIVDRYADYMDLSTTSCVITYTNALGNSYMYTVPFYDIYTFANEKKIILPWCLGSEVSIASGVVEFAIQFFKTGYTIDPQTNKQESLIIYSLNTLPAKSQVLKGMSVKQFDKGYKLNASQYQELIGEMNKIITFKDDEQYDTYWTTYWDIVPNQD